MSKVDENIDINIESSRWTDKDVERRHMKSGFIELEGMEGCANWEEVDMQDLKYDEHTRFVKTLSHFVRWGLSDWYSNAGVF